MYVVLNEGILMDFPCIKKYLSEGWIDYLIKKNPHQAQEETLFQLEECLRFLSLSHFSFGNIPVSQKIDDIWHLLILETRSYEALCLALPGKRFIHHSSHDFKSSNAVISHPEEAQRQLEWLVNYVSNFGEFTEQHLAYWPFAKALMEKLHLDVPSFYQKLLALAKR